MPRKVLLAGLFLVISGNVCASPHGVPASATPNDSIPRLTIEDALSASKDLIPSSAHLYIAEQILASAEAGKTTQPPLEPGKTYRFSAVCRGSRSQPERAYGICLSVDIIGTPGHQHPSPPPIILPDGDACKSGIAQNTTVYWRVIMPEFASNLRVTGVFSGACTTRETKTGAVGVDGLSSLGAGAGYVLVGQTNIHPQNHFGKTEALINVPQIAAQYKKEFPADPDLAINDISLPYGGLFDFKNMWAPPHKSHRFGYNVDIRLSSVPMEHRARLEQIFIENHARWIKEGEPLHYHLDFTPEGSVYFEETLSCD